VTMPQRIDRLFAWVVTHADGGQGIPSIRVGGMALPLVGADLARMNSLRDSAMTCLEREDCVGLELVEFSARRLLEKHRKPRVVGK
jgi:hypothetical protein